MLMQLLPDTPFHFSEMLKRPLSRPSGVALVNAETNSYTTVLRLLGKLIPVTVWGVGSIDNTVLQAEYPDDLSEAENKQVVRQLRHIFAMDSDLAGFYSTLSHDKRWEGLLKRFRGLRPIQDSNLFESMVRIVIGQQLNVKFAATLVERLVKLNDEAVNWHDEVIPVFPGPETVASWSYDELRQQSFSQRKAEYVIDFARLVVDGKVDLDDLWSMESEQVFAKMLAIRGVGRWTVECFLLFGMGREDLIPAGDIGIQNALQKLYSLSYRPKEVEVREFAEEWSPYRSYATYYLWQSLL
ncbi:DNA-3-methyladenine glycosylase [Alicyclobacillus sp. SO9]|uniref:DNA-3-methyladenine glycosylase family protein n=1 Tax=Alicyclobacillus sp. SO9 TaxID=2665646 RepID=UPI0018E7DCCF|nr:DNA-3-methyladenine glycosylase [Alicyclobacillus sp. SO9]QQE77190.1 DNA-3-methyladenine glycosylase 2 family protein [Alicyclobacillus sp. SO9]